MNDMENLRIDTIAAAIEDVEDEEDEEYDHDNDDELLDFDIETIEEEPSLFSRLQILLVRIKSTRTCFVIYITMALVCGIIFIIAAFVSPRSIVMIVTEAFINLLLALEVITEIITSGWDYWKHVGNVIDFLVTIACIAFFFTFLEEKRNLESFDDIPALNAILLGIRYSFQLFRALLCAVRGHHTMQRIAQDEVEVHDLELKNMVRVSREEGYDRSQADTKRFIRQIKYNPVLPRLSADSESSFDHLDS